MTQRIGSAIDSPALDYCQHADTVVSGFLCDEPTAVSDACRAPTNDIDDFICNDGKMANLQGSILDGLKEAAKVIFSALVGRSK